MGRVIHLPDIQPALPDAVAALDPAEATLVRAIRSWVADHLGGNDPLPHLLRSLDAAGAHDAAFSIDRLMGILARTARRVIAIHCPRCPQLSADEKRLLHAAGLAQVGESELAERVLRRALLSAQGAEVALGPLEGLGRLFAEARLFFRQRRPPNMDVASPDVPEVWTPETSNQLRH